MYSRNPMSPSTVGKEIRKLLDHEKDNADQIDGSKILEFAGNYLKWMFRVQQSTEDPKMYNNADMDDDEEIIVSLGSLNKKF